MMPRAYELSTKHAFQLMGTTSHSQNSKQELHVASPDLPKFDDRKDDTNTSFLAERAGKCHEELNAQPELKMRKKKELCGRYARGQCLLGKVCGNAHGESELGMVSLAVR